MKVSPFIQVSPALHLQLWSAIQVTYTIISHPLIAAVQPLLLCSVQFSLIMLVHAKRWSCWTDGLQGNGFVRCVSCWESVFHFFSCSTSSWSLTVLMCPDSHLCCDPVKTDFSSLITLTGSVVYFEILPLNKVFGVFMERCDVLHIKSNEGR